MTCYVVHQSYKLHRYLPGYKPCRPKQASYANQASGLNYVSISYAADVSPVVSSLPFSKEQDDQLIQLLKIHSNQQSTHHINVTAIATLALGNNLLNASFILIDSLYHSVFNSKHASFFSVHFTEAPWIIDLGDTDHIVVLLLCYLPLPLKFILL